MRRPYQKAVSLFILIVSLMMSLGAYGLNSSVVIHELDHARQSSLPTGDHHYDHHYVSQIDAPDAPNPEPLSDAEHKLLHALTHFEQLPSWTFVGLGEPTPGLAPALPTLLTLLPAALESPFRPPRNTSLT